MTTVTSLNGLTGALSLSGFGTSIGTGSTIGTVELSSGSTTLSIGPAVTTFTGHSYAQGGVYTRSGNVTLTAGDVSNAISSGNIYNLIDYGGDPTGVNDSHVALGNCIAAAVAGNGVAYIPSGTYTLGSPVAVSSSGTSSTGSNLNFCVVGDSYLTTVFQVTHTGIGLTLALTDPNNDGSSISVRNICFESVTGTNGLSRAALSITLPSVQTIPGQAGKNFIQFLCEDVKVWGAGSINASNSQAFSIGLELFGGYFMRINRFNYYGPLEATTFAAGIELTSCQDTYIDSCHFANGNFALAILDGSCGGIYFRNSTVIGS